jgi:hypothetical protein
MIFGYGDYNHSNVINQIFGVTDPNGYYPCDSSYMTILAKFGYFGIVLYAGTLGSICSFTSSLAIIHRSKAWYYYLLMFICIDAISVTEAHPLLGLSSQSMMLVLGVGFALAQRQLFVKHPEAQEADVPQVLPPYQPVENYDVTRLSFFITTPIDAWRLFPLALYSSDLGSEWLFECDGLDFAIRGVRVLAVSYRRACLFDPKEEFLLYLVRGDSCSLSRFGGSFSFNPLWRYSLRRELVASCCACRSFTCL